MKPIVVDDRHKKCPYCYTDFERGFNENDSKWQRHTYCSKFCAGKGGVAEHKRRQAAARRVILGDN